jgi:beta-barrel assembly-enhancing protease
MISDLNLPLFFLLTLFSFTITPVNGKEIILPDIGASSSISLSPIMENKIGRSVMNQLQNSHGIIDDLEINEYISNLGYSIVEQTDDGLQPFHFFLLNSNQINAFATPGGVIAVYSGLFLNTDSESELASVISHEIAHVTQHHIARAFEEASQMNIPMTIGLVAAILLGATGAPEAGMAAATGLQAMGAQAQINFTRSNEKEADRVGIKYLYKANYNPYGMPEFFQKLHKKNRYTGKNYPEFLRTHPVSIDRVSEAMSRANLYIKTQGNKKALFIKKDKNYRFMKGKLLVLSAKDSIQTENYYKQLSKTSTDNKNPEYQYSYALALLKNNKSKQAIEQFTLLYTKEPNNHYYINGLAKALLSSEENENNQKGLDLLKNALQQNPLNKILSANYADALIHMDKVNQSIKFINSYNQHNLKQPIFYQLLSRAYGKQGNLLEAHTAHAEYYYLSGRYKQAMTQIKIAKKLAKNDFYTLSRLESKLLEIEEEKKKYQLEPEKSDSKKRKK